MNDTEVNTYLRNLYFAFQLELAGVYGSRYTEMSKLVRQVLGSKTRSKQTLMKEYLIAINKRGVVLT